VPADFLEAVGFGARHTRRRFLSWVNIAAGGVISLIVGVPAVAYLLEPIIKSPPQVWEDLGPVSEYAVGETKLVSFQDVGSVPWSGKTSKGAVYVRQDPEGVFVVWAENCTHLGCPLNWLPRAGIFECPCHGGVFYADGSVAAGPPPHPMFRHQVRIQGGHLQALAMPLQAVE
jgi:quinol---cytochrome c reductase iron-sulfur subunit, bacillus type